MGVPNFVIDQFSIPPFLLPIYQACGTEYGIPWQVLASINRIETAFGTNLNVSTAGALGLDAVHARDLGGLRRRRQQRRPQGPLQPGRRDLRRRPLPERRRRRGGSAHRDLRLQPRRLVRRRGPALREPVRQAPRRPGRLADRPHRGRPLPGRRRRPLRRRHLRARGRRSAPPPARASPATPPTSSRPHPHVEGSTSTRRRALRSSPSTTASSRRSARPRSSASTSSSRTPTATASPTPSSAASPRPTRCPKEKKLTADDFRLVTPGDDKEPVRSPPAPAPAGRRRRRPRRSSTETQHSEPRRRGGQARPPQHRGHARAPLRLPGASRERRPRRRHRPARRAARHAASPATRASSPTSAAS